MVSEEVVQCAVGPHRDSLGSGIIVFRHDPVGDLVVRAGEVGGRCGDVGRDDRFYPLPVAVPSTSLRAGTGESGAAENRRDILTSMDEALRGLKVADETGEDEYSFYCSVTVTFGISLIIFLRSSANP